jgi:hypothetical protein
MKKIRKGEQKTNIFFQVSIQLLPHLMTRRSALFGTNHPAAIRHLPALDSNPPRDCCFSVVDDYVRALGSAVCICQNPHFQIDTARLATLRMGDQRMGLTRLVRPTGSAMTSAVMRLAKNEDLLRMNACEWDRKELDLNFGRSAVI